MLIIDSKQFTAGFDQRGINEATVALGREMLPAGGALSTDADTMFIGSGPRTAADLRSLAQFGQDKNYKLVLPVFDPVVPAAQPVRYDVVVTDGVAETIILLNGRLWKRDRRSASVLLFAETGIVVTLSTKGFMLIRGMKGGYDEAGYERALDAVATRAARKPGKAPVITHVGSLAVVLDLAAWLNWLSSGERPYADAA